MWRKLVFKWADFYWLKGRHVEALQSYRKVEETLEQLGDKRGLGDVADAATLHYDRGELDEAERSYRRAILLEECLRRPARCVSRYVQPRGNLDEEG